MDIHTYTNIKKNGFPNNSSEHDFLKHSAMFVDHAGDLGDELALKQAIASLKERIDTSSTDKAKARVHYYIANAWRHLRDIEIQSGNEEWVWKNEALEQETLYLRKALITATPDVGIPICEIWTNLGNALDHIGRPVEAIECYDNALYHNSAFAMAIGNKALAMYNYAKRLYDNCQRTLMLKLTHSLLDEATKYEINESSRSCFEQKSKIIEELVPVKCHVCEADLNSKSLGEEQEEMAYRKWCLEERLFLNPLNDIMEYTVAAYDPLSFPRIMTAIDDGPYFHGFFNQLKQEFVSARYLFYEGIMVRTCHFSDQRVILHNTLDYPRYGLGIEKTKLAFRAAYSLFDKIAYFINAYFDLDIPEREIYFKTIWRNKNGELRVSFKNRPNLCLRGLFWLSKDLFEKENETWQESLEPDAQELNNIRNSLEHKYVKIHDDAWNVAEQHTFTPIDQIAKSLCHKDFNNKCKRLLKMCRAALIYLVLAIHQEEKLKAGNISSVENIPKITLSIYEDNFKS